MSLTLVATPIGNLEDISARALQALKECDAILCEDTRRSSLLLDRFHIDKPLISYHKFKEKQSLEKIVRELEAGKHFALLSDAGTPCINDPGLILVQACIEKKIPFTAIPGPCSVIQALLLSGMETERFQFIGFLPKKGNKELRQAFGYPGTTVAFESPERLIQTLRSAQKIDPSRSLAVAREMTKKFEECLRGTAEELLAHFEAKAPRGEVVLLIAGGSLKGEMPLDELLEMLQTLHGLSLKEAIKMAAKLTGQPKSALYKQVHL